MPSKIPLRVLVALFSVILGSLAIATPLLAASKEKVLYSFCPVYGCADGSDPQSGVFFDNSGNLYGTTYDNGAYRRGTVFELIPGNGGWTEKVLHNFTRRRHSKHGHGPSSLIMDASGQLYGTTVAGGSGCPGYQGCGTVFQMTPDHGNWTLKVVHQFNGKDGFEPWGDLVPGDNGKLYGTASEGGAYVGGTVFELTPNHGAWTENVLHSFGNGKDGVRANRGLISDAAGNLYGTTFFGGTSANCRDGCGIAFELIPNNGKWTEKVLHNFNRENGAYPVGGLILDGAGNLYGTTSQGGAGPDCASGGCGTVFELSPGENGNWTEKVLHSFDHNFEDGYTPYASLLFDSAGNLYGTTYAGGTYDLGAAFELTPRNGKWTEKVLHSFNGTDGAIPSNLIMDAAGNLYGSTVAGGAYGKGTVFEIVP
jgi:uncharacterized repeat protein (TIGR03803 family)